MSRAKRIVELALSFAFVVGSVSEAVAADPNSAAKKKGVKTAPRKPPLPPPTKSPQKPKSSPPKAPENAPAPSSEPEDLSMRDQPLAAPRTALAPAAPAVVERDTGVLAPAASRARSIGREIVTVEAGVGAGMRHFSYNDRRTPTLSPYRLDGSPVLSLSGELFPLPLDGVFDVGVAGNYKRAMGVSSASTNNAGGANVSTSWSHFRVGPRARFRFGANDSTVLGASVAYGQESFDIDEGNAASQTVVPEVAYTFIRPSFDARLSFGRISPFAEIGYSAIVSAGFVSDRFPNASVGGVDAAIGVGFRLTDHLELRAAVAYRRYFYAFDPRPGDRYVAGGALDEMSDGKLALAWFM